MWCRRLSGTAARTASHTKRKIQHYIETGEVKKRHEAPRAPPARTAASSGLSLAKTLQLLRAKHDSVSLTDAAGQPVNLYSVTPAQLHVHHPASRRVFSALAQFRRLARTRLDDAVLMSLLGVTRASLADSYFVASDVARLLRLDNDPARALEVCRLAKDKSAVAMNAVVEWHLRRADLAGAKKVMATRKKWGVPLTATTGVVYFSGVADCHAWGRVSDATADEVVALLHHAKTPRTVETFNAALKVLVKNYTDGQARAWALFDALPELRVRPDAHTFTILLQGCKTYHGEQMAAAAQDAALSAAQRSARLYATHAQLARVAAAVLAKAVAAATPPAPPTRDAADRDPQALPAYKAATRFPPVDIDRHLAVMFLSCLAHPAAGTAWSARSGAHYAYLEHALLYLQAWVPEARQLAAFVARGDVACDGRAVEAEPFAAAADVRRKTDARVQSARVPADDVPANVVRARPARELNPPTLFPPSPFSKNKTSAIFSRVEKPLVDFARVRFAALHSEHRANAEAVKQKKARPQTKTALAREPHALNKFLLRIFVDALARLGLYREFHLAVWYAAAKWAAIPVDLPRMWAHPGLAPRALAAHHRPQIVALPHKTPFVARPTNASTAVVDIALVEDFLFKMDDTFPQNVDSTALACELVAAFSNKQLVQTKELLARPSTYNAVFAMLNKDIYSYNDHNRAEGSRASRRGSRPDNTARSSLTAAQLHSLLDSLHALVESIFVRFECATMDSGLVSSYNSLVNRIYTTTWSDAPESSPKCVALHTKIIRSGILMWRPRALIDGRKKETYSELILRSMEFVYERLKSRSDLTSEEKVLMVTLRSMFKLAPGDEEKFAGLRMKVYRVCKEVLDKV